MVKKKRVINPTWLILMGVLVTLSALGLLIGLNLGEPLFYSRVGISTGLLALVATMLARFIVTSRSRPDEVSRTKGPILLFLGAWSMVMILHIPVQPNPSLEITLVPIAILLFFGSLLLFVLGIGAIVIGKKAF